MKLSPRFLAVADNHEVLQAHFLKKVLELPSLTPSVKYSTQPNASSVKYILLRRKFRAKFSNNIYIYTVFGRFSLLLNEYHVINRAESPLDDAQRKRFSKIVN